MSSRRVVWMNKEKAMPTWLWLGVQDGRDDVSFRYWLKIWYAIPGWAKYEEIAAIYKEAYRRREAGEKVHVDHIVPLTSKRVCGLHVANNLQIINDRVNMQKGNHYWPGAHMELQELELPETEPEQMELGI